MRIIYGREICKLHIQMQIFNKIHSLVVVHQTQCCYLLFFSLTFDCSFVLFDTLSIRYSTLNIVGCVDMIDQYEFVCVYVRVFFWIIIVQ